ncbi:MAG: Fic family protein [Oscillospiraceae bacterium]|nr:Fic family protein [Oscillospiraceae bacterium]
MENRYSMSVEQNIFVAKRNIVDYIWKSARLEGLGVTYPDTEAIYNGMSVQGVKVDEIIAVNNLKRAWQFVLETLEPPLDLPYICRINQIVGGDNLIINAGYLRMTPVSIGGTSWKPAMPDEATVKEELARIAAKEGGTERAIELMLYCMRGQLFLDGNKRTAMLAANKVMIENGAGIISIPIEIQRDFTKLLVEFYETGEAEEIKDFVYNHCVDGMEFPAPETQKEKEQKKARLSRDER